MLAANQMFQEAFFGWCLPFDEQASTESALLVAIRMGLGRPISTEDAQIASIAMCHQLPLVTRNVKNFEQVAKSIIHSFERCYPIKLD